MKQQERSQSVIVLFLVSGVVVILTIVAISTLGHFNSQGPLSIQPTRIPTQIENSTPTLNAGTQKAILHATWSAITRTPFPTQELLPTGTREGDMVKFSAEKMFLTALNGWDGYLDNISVVIYAGSLPDDPEQGAIVIHFRLPYRFFSEKLLTPTKHGGVRVVAEQNNRLTLFATDGEIFYFDVPARRFVTSLTEVVPTATPPPSLTPSPYVGNTPEPTYNPYPLPTELVTEVP